MSVDQRSGTPTDPQLAAGRDHRALNVHIAMRTLLTLGYGVMLLSSDAQLNLQHEWTRRFSTPLDGEKFWRLSVDEEGNVYAAGGFSGTFSEDGISVTSVGGADILLAKYDPQGQLLWARSAGGPSNDVAFGVDSDKDGRVYITGGYSGFAVFGDTALATPAIQGAQPAFAFVARYSPEGDLDWVRGTTYDGTISQNSIGCVNYAIKLDRFGDLVVAGSYSSPEQDANDPVLSPMRWGGIPYRYAAFPGQPYVCAYKLDTLGNTIWLHTVGDPTFAPNDPMEGFGSLVAVDVDASNNVWLGGDTGPNNTFNSGPVSLTTSVFQALIYALSPAGEPLSAFVLPASGTSSVEDMVVTADDDLWIGGYYSGEMNGEPPAQNIAGFVTRATTEGQVLWSNQLDGPLDDFISGMATTSDTAVLLAGGYYFYEAEVGGTTLSTSPGNNSAVLAFGTDGALIDALQPLASSGSTFLADVQCDRFSNIFACGDVTGQAIFTNDTVTCLTQDTYVTKISDQRITAVEAPSGVARPALILYPNPCTDRITVRSPALRGSVLELLDATGRVVLNVAIASGNKNAVDVSGIAPGTYRAVLTAGDERWSQGLVVAR